MRTVIIATPTAESWTTPTPVQCAPGQVQGTTRTQPASTRWVAQVLVFTRPSSHWRQAAPRPTCAPKRNNSSSNIRLYRTSRCRGCRPLPGSKRHLLSDTAGCLQLATMAAVRPTSTYGAIRIAHSLVQSNAPKASVRSESHTCWCNQNCTKSKRASKTAHSLVRSKSHQEC